MLSIYDGPIDGWFYVQWGLSDEEQPRKVSCQCDPCFEPCKEDGVPEYELAATAPDILAAYKLTETYRKRNAEMQRTARFELMRYGS